MEVPENIYSWVKSTGAFQLPPSKGKFSLPQDVMDALLLGQGFVPIIKRMNQIKVTAEQNEDDETPSPIYSLSNLKNIKTPANLLHNWKIVTKALELFNVQVDQDLQTLIIAGDMKAVLEVLKLVKESEANGFAVGKKQNQGLDINTIDDEKSLDDAESCLEFFILSFTHSFRLSSKQATGLLAQGCKYLAHIIAKGLKGEFEPVRSWLQDLYVTNDKLSSLMSNEQDSGSTQFVLSAIKPGILSKDLEVVQWTFRVLSRLILDLNDKQMMDDVWKWFIDDNLIEICIQSMKRNGADTQSHAIDFMMQISQFNLVGYFSVHLRNVVNDNREYYEIICQILDHSKESQSSIEEIADSGIIAYWTEMASKDSDFGYGKPRDSRASGLIFLGKIVTVFWSYFELNEGKMNSILGLLNRTCRDDNKILKYLSIGMMFHLFELLTENKSNFAPVIYRTLTFLLVETYNISEIRQFIQDNFTLIFKKTENIPIGILVEPYIKRLQVNDVALEVFDFEFLIIVSQYPTLTLKQGIQIIDLLGKSYLNDLVYSKLSGVPFTYLASRFISQNLMQDYLYVFSEYGLNLAVSTESKRLKKGKKPVELEESIQQRNKVLDMVYWIIQQWQDNLNDKYKVFLVQLINDFYTANSAEFNGLHVLLDLLGDAKLIIEESRPINQLALIESAPESIDNYQLQPVIETVTQRKDKLGAFPWERINDDIEKAKKRRLEKDKKLKEEEEKIQKQLEVKKKKLKKQLEVRKLEQGVSRNDISSLVYKEGVVQKYISQDEVTLKTFTAEEADLEESINLMMSKYSRVFKLLFFKYSGTGFEKKNHAKTDFDLHAERKSKLNDAELIKMLKDFAVIPKLISKEEVKMIMRNYNLKIAKQPEQWFVDYKGFKGTFVQIAFFVYSRRPHDYSHLPPVVSLKFLLDHMRDTYKAQGKNTEMFDEPDPGTGDKELVRSLNKALQKDPKIPVPEGYEKIADKEISVYFSIPDSAHIPQAFKVSIEIIDQVLFSALGIHLLEPQISQTTSYRVKGKPIKKELKQQPPIYERVGETTKPKEKSSVPERKSQKFIEPETKASKDLKNQTSLKESKELPNLKDSKEIERKQTLDRKDTKDTKNTKDQNNSLSKPPQALQSITSVQPSKSTDKNPAKSTALLRSDLKQEPIKLSQASPDKSSKVLALTEKVEDIRRRDRDELDKSRSEEERKRITRQMELQEEIRKAKLARQQMLREEEERKKNQDFLDELQKKVAEERLKKAKDERKKLLESWQKRKEDDQKQKEIEESIKKKMNEDVHRIEESRKRNMQRLMEELKNRESKVKKFKEEETERLKKIIKEKEVKKKIGLQHYYENKVKDANQQVDTKKEFLFLINNNEIKRFVERYSDQIGDIFAFYLLRMGNELTNETSINFSCFNRFCEDFNIYEITSREQCQSVFNFLTKKKSQAVINSEEFNKSLILIANIGKERLDIEESGVKPIAKFFEVTEIELNVKDLKRKLNRLKDPEVKKSVKKRPLSLINAAKNLMSRKPAEEMPIEKSVNRSLRHSSNNSSRSQSSYSNDD